MGAHFSASITRNALEMHQWHDMESTVHSQFGTVDNPVLIFTSDSSRRIVICMRPAIGVTLILLKALECIKQPETFYDHHSPNPQYPLLFRSNFGIWGVLTFCEKVDKNLSMK